MAILPIITAPDSRLKKVSKPVEKVDDGIRKLLDDMLETMYAAPGIGLAAPQVGVTKRVIVVDVAQEGAPGEPLKLINPELLEVAEDDATYEEGCLSLPEQYAEVVRPAGAKIRYLDTRGEEQIIEADGLLATCIQHEIDHLDGILFVDHVSALKRNIILRKLTKMKRTGQPESVSA